jgi:hypothetical protein
MKFSIPMYVTHLHPIQGKNDFDTLKLIAKRALTLKEAEAIFFIYNNCRFSLSRGTIIDDFKLFIRGSNDHTHAFVICGKRPQPDDFRRAINKIVIQEIHML